MKTPQDYIRLALQLAVARLKTRGLTVEQVMMTVEMPVVRSSDTRLTVKLDFVHMNAGALRRHSYGQSRVRRHSLRRRRNARAAGTPRRGDGVTLWADGRGRRRYAARHDPARRPAHAANIFHLLLLMVASAPAKSSRLTRSASPKNEARNKGEAPLWSCAFTSAT